MSTIEQSPRTQGTDDRPDDAPRNSEASLEEEHRAAMAERITEWIAISRRNTEALLRRRTGWDLD